VGSVFSPLDEELALLPGNLAPRQQDHVVHLASWMPFKKAASMMEKLLGVQISEETARRLTERMGDALEQAQTEEAHAPFQEAKEGECLPENMAFSADGAMVGLVGGEWAEVRTLVIGKIKEQAKKKKKPGSQEPRVVELSSFSRLVGAEKFCQLAEVEMRRRGVIQAKQVCAVMDGADWLQEFVDVHREDAVRILDFPHAAEHVNSLLEALVKAGYTFPSQMLERCLHILKHRGPSFLLSRIDRLPPPLLEQNGIREHVGYLRKREALMQYPTFLKQGLPIGSGMVESANKLVVEARLKGAGMRWERKNVNKMLTLRNGVCSDRWQATWQEAGLAVCQQQKQRRKERTERREEAKLLTCNPLLLQSPPPPPKAEPTPVPLPPAPPTPPATLPGSSRPSAHHPWKRSFRPGRVSSQKDFAKI
jgi:hypothetical protein